MISSSSILYQVLSSLLSQLPMLIASGVGLVLALLWWQKAPQASLWAALGFGLTLALCVLLPIVHQMVWRNLAETASTTRANVAVGLSFVSSLLHACCYVLLLMAVYAGRQPDASRRGT
jgi:hypothetical protein